VTDFPGLTDIHCHPAMNSFLWGRKLERHYWTGKGFDPLASLTDFKMMREGDLRVVWSALHVPESEYFRCRLIRFVAHFFRGGRALLKKDAWECLLLQMDQMERQVGEAEDIALARSNAELDRITAPGDKTAIVHTVEGGHSLSAGLAPDDVDTRLQRLQQLADRGVASLTVAHLFPNDLAGHAEGIPEKDKSFPTCKLDTHVDLSLGLTEAGRAVVDRMVELKMLPDITHCTPKARHEIYARVNNRVPIIASHIGVQTLNPVPYNLDESDVQAIVASGGVVGVIFMPYWLERTHPGPGLESIWQTMKTVRDWGGGGWGHVAIGTDFDGFTDPSDDCKSLGELPRIRVKLEAEGVTGTDLEGILGTNAREVLRKAWR
jgi:membrane dipeptidase